MNFRLRSQVRRIPAVFLAGAEARERRLQSSLLCQIRMTSLNPEAVRESDLRKCEARMCIPSNAFNPAPFISSCMRSAEGRSKCIKSNPDDFACRPKGIRCEEGRRIRQCPE